MSYLDETKHHSSICACVSPEHTVQWAYSRPITYTEKGVQYNEPGEVWFYVSLTWNQSFLKRLWNAIKYVTGQMAVLEGKREVLTVLEIRLRSGQIPNHYKLPLP